MTILKTSAMSQQALLPIMKSHHQRHPVYQMHKSAGVAGVAAAGLDCASVSDEMTITSTTTTPTVHYINARRVEQHLNQKRYMISIDYFAQL